MFANSHYVPVYDHKQYNTFVTIMCLDIAETGLRPNNNALESWGCIVCIAGIWRLPHRVLVHLGFWGS